MTIAQAKSALQSAKAFQSEVNQILKKEPQSGLLTISEVSRMFRVDRTTVRRWVKLGALEAISLPARGKRQIYRVKRDTVEKLLKVGS